MHSFQHSRGKNLFEVFCALAMSASCVAAWMQTGASALLAAAAVAALYGIVHAFDLAGRNRLAIVDQPQSEGAKDSQPNVLAYHDGGAQPAAASRQLESATASEEAERVEPAAPRQSQASRTKARRKSGGRRASAPEEAKVTELARPAEADALPLPLEEAKVTELARPAEAEVALPLPPEEAVILHIEPLFEPETFVKMPRRAFGRKSG